jgi:hypothetical protein
LAQLAPALGLAWANSVSVRLMLARTDGPLSDGPALVVGDGAAAAAEVDRRLYVLGAPHLPHGAQRFRITNDGVEGLA